MELNSIAHKYLIKGHTHNEGDFVHSLIERQVKRLLRSGPIYTPESFITAKKEGDPFNVKEFCYDDFYNIKLLANQIGPMNMKGLKLSDVKVLKVIKDSPISVFYKYSYSEDYQETRVIKEKNCGENIILLPCFNAKPGIESQKKNDLIALCEKNLIPKPYHVFHTNL